MRLMARPSVCVAVSAMTILTFEALSSDLNLKRAARNLTAFGDVNPCAGVSPFGPLHFDNVLTVPSDSPEAIPRIVSNHSDPDRHVTGGVGPESLSPLTSKNPIVGSTIRQAGCREDPPSMRACGPPMRQRG